MQRRNFLNTTLLGTSSLLFSNRLFASFQQSAAPSFKLNYAIHDGMFKNNGGNNFIDQIKFAYDMGFRAIEDNGMMSRTKQEQEAIGNTLAKLGMAMGVFVITSDNWHWKTTITTGKQEWIDKMLKECEEAVAVAKRCGAKWMTVVPGNYERNLSEEIQTVNVINALRKASALLEKHQLVMVLEPLSDNADLFLRHSHQTYLICKAVNSPSCKILFDMYHMQRNEGDIINNIDKTWDEIGYIQIGDNPGRNEPTTGEMNYKNIFKHIHSKGFKGILGMEHGNARPGKEGEMALIEAYRYSDGF